MNEKRRIKVILKDVIKKQANQYKPTSVTLSNEQIDFIKKKNINLSELMRSILDDLIEQDSKE